jgi:hypothetical protein
MLYPGLIWIIAIIFIAIFYWRRIRYRWVNRKVRENFIATATLITISVALLILGIWWDLYIPVFNPDGTFTGGFVLGVPIVLGSAIGSMIFWFEIGLNRAIRNIS